MSFKALFVAVCAKERVRARSPAVLRNHLVERQRQQRLSASDAAEQLFPDSVKRSQFMRKPGAADLRGQRTGLRGEDLIERHPLQRSFLFGIC